VHQASQQLLLVTLLRLVTTAALKAKALQAGPQRQLR
jgi:hypothetical protein